MSLQSLMQSEDDSLLQYLLQEDPTQQMQQFMASMEMPPPMPVVNTQIQLAFDMDADFDTFLQGDSDDEGGMSPPPASEASSETTSESASDQHAMQGNSRKRKQQLAKASKKHRLRQKDELSYLRGKVGELENQLDMLQKLKDMECEHGSQWEQLARSQFLEKQKAYQENQKLKMALEEQLKFAQALETMIRKKPRLTLASSFDNEEWKLNKLPRDQEGRKMSIVNIMQKQYEALNAVYVRNGLFDPKKEVRNAKMSYIKDNTLKIEHSRFTKMPWSYDITAEAVWKVCSREDNMLEEFGAKVLDIVDDNTVYVKLEVCRKNGPCKIFGKSKVSVLGFVIFKRFIEKNRIVVLCKSILEDDLHPQPDNVLLSDHNSWIVVERGSEPNVSLFKSFVERNPPTKAGQVLSMDEMMKHLHIPKDLECPKSSDSSGQTDSEDNCNKPGAISDYILQSFTEVALKHEEAIKACAARLASSL